MEGFQHMVFHLGGQFEILYVHSPAHKHLPSVTNSHIVTPNDHLKDKNEVNMFSICAADALHITVCGGGAIKECLRCHPLQKAVSVQVICPHIDLDVQTGSH